MGLDLRVFKAIVRGGYQQPTLVQSKTIPLILENRDLLVRSRTGTGKTLAYLLPLLHKVLALLDGSVADKNNNVNQVYGMVLVPSTDLVYQVLDCIKDLKVSSTLRFSDSSGISQQPHILVCTPEEAVQLCQDHVISLNLLKILVMDEADLILSYGYQDDMKVLRTSLPTLVQTILISATLTPEVDGLRLNFLNNPVIVKLEETIGQEQLVQHYINVQEHEKLLYLLSIIIYTVQNQRTIVYCNDMNTAFTVHLFLTKFNIHSGILNIELPYNSRQAILKKFNQNIINVLICIDESQESDLLDMENVLDSQVSIDVVDERDEESVKASKKKKELTTKKKENNSTRGMDLKDVMYVINYNFPTTYKAYTHRIGRTARAGKSGMALSFVANNEKALLANVIENQSIVEGKDIIAANDVNITEMPFSAEAVAPFRVRVFDVKKTITHRTVKEARLDAVRQELINSEKLKAHFEDNPHELHLLKNSGHTMRKKYSKELNYIPQYLIPQEFKNQGIIGGTIGGAGVEKVKTKKKTTKKRKTDDPLMNLTNKKNKTKN